MANKSHIKRSGRIRDKLKRINTERFRLTIFRSSRNISAQIFKAFLENAASEQGSRMTAMDNATRNAGDLVDKLTITYNRSRQAAITKELIEIISGAESL